MRSGSQKPTIRAPRPPLQNPENHVEKRHWKGSEDILKSFSLAILEWSNMLSHPCKQEQFAIKNSYQT